MDRFLGGEREAPLAGRDRYLLSALRAQVHLDAASCLVVERLVHKTLAVELASELGIDSGQDVEVESFGHPGCVVVGGVQDRDVFLKVEADEQRVSRFEVLTLSSPVRDVECMTS